MTSPRPFTTAPAAGSQDLPHRGWYIAFLQSFRSGNNDTRVQIYEKEGWVRAFRVPRPVVGVIGGTGAGGIMEVSQEASLVGPIAAAIPPANALDSGEILNETDGVCTWLQFWSEGGRVESDGFVSEVAFVGPGAPGPISFGVCFTPIHYSASNT